MIKNISFLLARVFVGGVFTYAGWAKLMEPMENFRGMLASYEMLPYAIIPFLAYTLPWVELLFGIFLILGYATRLSALALGGLSFSFVLLLTTVHIFSPETVSAACGCFGQGGLQLTKTQMLYLDIVNTLLCAWLLKQKKNWLSLDGGFPSR